MSTYVLMKILESAPNRYDTGIRLLTLGGLDPVYRRLTSHINGGDRVLDLGCGTGALTLLAARKNATVKAIDVNPQMLEVAARRAEAAGVKQLVEFCEMGVAELGSEERQYYDVVMAGLCFSELTEDELAYTLVEVKRILKPNGLLLIADEVKPQGFLRRWSHWLIRSLLMLVTYALTQTTTHAIEGLPERVSRAGFLIQSVNASPWGSFIELVARNPE